MQPPEARPLFDDLPDPLPATPAQAAPLSAAAGDPVAALSHEQQHVLLALVLPWTGRPRTWVYDMLRELGATDSHGPHATPARRCKGCCAAWPRPAG